MNANDPKSARIAIVDDESINIKVVRKHLQGAGYSDFISTTDSTTAVALITERLPDVILLDVMMPQVDGIQILTSIRADQRLRHLPVLILTASTDAQTKMRCLEGGATDFLAKPVDPNDLVPRLRNALIVKAHHDHLMHYAQELEHQVRIRTAELEASHLQVIYCLARAGELRDDTTGQHVLRVGRYASVLAREVGCSDSECRLIGLAAQLHDVGKIGIPDAILNKPGKLTTEEFALMQKHCMTGAQIARPLTDEEWRAVRSQDGAELNSTSLGSQPLLALVQTIITTHHERWDGRGYPNGIAGEAIPLPGRIVSVADVFDALTNKRPYKSAMEPQAALKIITEGSGSQFDPKVVAALLRSLDQILTIHRQLSDHQSDASPASVAAVQRPAA
jgi:putative two-component system response regulator